MATLLALGAAGCGATTTVPKDGTLRIALSDYRVTPQRVRTRAGVVTIVVRNYGRLSHNFVISLDGEIQASTPPIAPGQTAELEQALVPGRYVMSSLILSDQALGAYGSLDVGS
jgi:hypothetical protein